MTPADLIVLRKRKATASKLWEHADALFDKGKTRRAHKLFKRAALMGSDHARVRLADSYCEGGSSRFNFPAARRWYLRAYRLHDSYAANNYGQALRMRGRDVEAVRWLLIAASEDDALSPHLWIARIYLKRPETKMRALEHLKLVANAPETKIFEDEDKEATALLAEHFPNA